MNKATTRLVRVIACAVPVVSAGAQRGAQRPPPDYSAPADAPYVAVEVTVPTPMGHTLAGTLTVPKTASADHQVGAVVTITGSGSQTRDEGGIFRIIADSLARRGIATLRMDDRGAGGSKGDFRTATSADFGEDIRAGLAFLRTRIEIDPKRLGLVGHSEGAVIAPMVALKEPDIRALVLLASSAKSGRLVIEYQLANNIQHDTTLTAEQRAAKLARVPAAADSQHARNKWYGFFMDYDPAVTAKQIKSPAILILTGANDQQATPDQVPVLDAAFKSAGNRDVTARVLPNLNHLFKYDLDGYPGGYSRIRTEVEPVVPSTVAGWLAERFTKP